MEKQILEILAENGRMSAEEIAVMLGASKTEIAEKIAELESNIIHLKNVQQSAIVRH